MADRQATRWALDLRFFRKRPSRSATDEVCNAKRRLKRAQSRHRGRERRFWTVACPHPGSIFHATYSWPGGGP